RKMQPFRVRSTELTMDRAKEIESTL
ncbi:hypothetical protein CCACVL1_15028, partial [Corchorus capsularis]